MDLEYKTFPFEMKASSPDGSAFEGLISVFYNIDAAGEIVDDGAFNADFEEFLANGFVGGLNHSWDNPIGTPQPGTKVTPQGLYLKANVIDTTHGMDVRKMLKAGVVKKLSIGYRTLGATMLEDADACMAYWQSKGYTPNAQDMARCQYGARLLTRMLPYEGSPVTVPANELAAITAVKRAAMDAAEKVIAEQKTAPSDDAEPAADWRAKLDAVATVRDAEEFLRDAGLSRKQAAALLSHLKPLLRDAASETPAPAADEAAPALPVETEQKADDAPAPDPDPIPDADPDTKASETPAPDPGPIPPRAMPSLIEEKRQTLAHAAYQRFLALSAGTHKPA